MIIVMHSSYSINSFYVNVDYILSSTYLRAIEDDSEDGEKADSDLSRNVTPHSKGNNSCS